MSKYTDLYIPLSNQNLYFVKNKSSISVNELEYSQEEVKIEENKEVLTGA